MTAADIIQLLDGDTVVARFLELPLTTVNSWKRFNHIPEWRKPKVLEMAMSKGVALSTDDFPTPAERVAA